MKALVLATVLALGLTGCGGEEKPKTAEPTAPPSTPPTSLGTLQGHLLLVGGPTTNKNTSVAGDLVITSNGSRIRGAIDKDTGYAIQLPAGTYEITATTPKYQNSDGVCRTSPATTELGAGKTVTADIVCVMK